MTMGIERSDRVCIIADADFGDRLSTCDMDSPIWIVRSGVNTPSAAALWRAKSGNITVYDPQDFADLIDTIILHHPDWRELEIIGVDAPQVRAALEPFGPGHLRETPDSLVFERAKT